jgi:hypothetical protein
VRYFADSKLADREFGDSKLADLKFGNQKFVDQKFVDRKFVDRKFVDQKFSDRNSARSKSAHGKKVYGMTQAIFGRARLAYSFAWLFGWQSDLLCFVAPVVFGAIMIYCPMRVFLLAAFCLFVVAELFPLVGTVHGAATWYHYTDKKNREYYFGTPKRLLLFLFAPMAISLLCAAAYVMHLKYAVFCIYMVWTVQHLTQQNVGILLLYHNPAEATVPRVAEARSLQIPAILFGALFIAHQTVDGPMFRGLALICILACLCISFHYLWQLYQKARDGAPTNIPALIFWLISVWFFLPVVFAGDKFYQAMLLPLFIHWCQYVGLNCVLVARKYQTEKRRKAILTRPVCAFILFCGVLAALFFYSIYLSYALDKEIWRDWMAGLVMGGSLVHYFLDAFIWRFREEFQRQTILPFLKPKKLPV